LGLQKILFRYYSTLNIGPELLVSITKQGTVLPAAILVSILLLQYGLTSISHLLSLGSVHYDEYDGDVAERKVSPHS
jgi:hypothetical protein